MQHSFLRASIIIAIIGACILTNVSVYAKTLRVPTDYLDIQLAVDAAASGDVVLVASGVHRLHKKHIVVDRKNIRLRSSLGPEKTVIEGVGRGPVISFLGSSNSTIEGFTITHVPSKEPTSVRGGGIFCAPYSSPIIINNIITGNVAVFGGGVYCGTGSAPFIKNNVISSNRASMSGAGIFAQNSMLSLTNTLLSGNEAGTNGGGLCCYETSLAAVNDLFWKNSSTVGGAISLLRSSSNVVNLTIVGNQASYGGGLHFDGGDMRVANSILWDNKDDLHSGLLGSSKPVYSDIKDRDFWGVNGNIAEDPMFADVANGDFHLKSGSPCLDTGAPDVTYKDADGSRNDMGVFGGPGGAMVGQRFVLTPRQQLGLQTKH